MTDETYVQDLLTQVLEALPTQAPERILASVRAGVATTPQNRRWPWLRGKGYPASNPPALRLAAGALALIVVALIGYYQFGPRPAIIGRGVATSPSPVAPSPATESPTPSPEPSASFGQSSTPSASIGAPLALEDVGAEGLTSGVPYTSRLFEPRVEFKLTARDGPAQAAGQETNWCSPLHSDAPRPYTSPRSIVLSYRAGCVSDLRLIRPYAVDCGTPDAHPDAATLAAAILANPTLSSANDEGTLQSAGAEPPGMFKSDYSGRAILITGIGRAFDPNAIDPDHCRLLPDPGSNDPTIEVRDDMPAALLLTDVDGELVVLRTSGGGYDATTGAAARSRGYGVVSPDLQGSIYDIQLGAAGAPAAGPSEAPATSGDDQHWVTYKLTGLGGVREPTLVTDWCVGPGYGAADARQNPRSIVLPFRHACVQDVRLLRPYAVDCGTPDPHPDAATLAAALLANPTLTSATSRGTIQNSDLLASDMFLHPYSGRVIQIGGAGRPFDPNATDPDHCRLLPEPGSADPIIEIRDDMGTALILTDVEGQLVVIRASGGGYDAATGAAVRERGYGVGAFGGWSLLNDIYDIEFVSKGLPPAPSPSEAAQPPASPAPPASSAPSASPDVPIAVEDPPPLRGGITYTSDLFQPHVTFKLTHHEYYRSANPEAAWCSTPYAFGSGGESKVEPHTSARSIVLSRLGPFGYCYPGLHLRIIRPYAVDCGTPDAHPDAATLATAIMAKPGMTGARRLGMLPSDHALPSGLFAGTYQGRAIDLRLGLAFDAGATDPDHCRLLPEPGSEDPIIEIRGDIPSEEILMDIGGELVVLRTEAGGYDATSGAAALAAGGGWTELLPSLLEDIYDIEFDTSGVPTAPGDVPTAPGDVPPAPSVADLFVTPFEYVVPAASTMRLTNDGPFLYGFVDGKGSDDRYGGIQGRASKTGARGVVIASLPSAVTHPCPMVDGQPSRVEIRTDPSGFLADMRAIAGAGVGAVASTTLASYPALTAMVDPIAARCAITDFHGGSDYVSTGLPSRLIVADVADTTIVVQVWAGTEEDLAAWLPTATEFVDSMRFTAAKP